MVFTDHALSYTTGSECYLCYLTATSALHEPPQPWSVSAIKLGTVFPGWSTKVQTARQVETKWTIKLVKLQ